MVYELGEQFKGDFEELRVLPASGDGGQWQELDEALKTLIIEEADQYLGYEYPRLTASMYLSFSEGGDRSRYQEAYSQIRYALDVLVKAECVTNNGRYLKDIINGIYVVCEESAWNLPAHNTYIRDTRGPVLPDYERPILALYSCETGANLALIDYMLGEQLDRVSPMIRKRIRCELERRILRPYLKEHFWWMGRGDEPMNNWTIWCTQNILITFFLSGQSHEILLKAFLKACKSVDYFLKEYEEDGCCDEGASYYRKSGLCLMNTLEILNSITRGHFQSVYDDGKIYNMAEFIVNMQVKDSYYINFADCSAVLEPSGVREYLFGLRTGNSRLMDYAARDYQNGWKEVKKPVKEYELNLYYHLQSMMMHSEVMTYKASDFIEQKDTFYESVGIAIVRDQQFCLAVKAGDNGDSHNHNDVGSYTLFREGQPFIVDIGVETYSAKTFSPRRYEIWTMQSDYHNVPTINGSMQIDGETYSACDVTFDNTASFFKAQMNIVGAYSKDCGVAKFLRHVMFNKGEEIVIEDRAIVEGHKNLPMISNMILYSLPRLDGNQLIFDNGSQISLEGHITKIEIEVLPIRDERLAWAWDHDLYRARIHYEDHRLVTVIR